MHQLAFVWGVEGLVKKVSSRSCLSCVFEAPFGRQDMERELWLALYSLVRELGASPWFAVTKFFRLGDRGRLPVGSGSRSTNELGLRPYELA